MDIDNSGDNKENESFGASDKGPALDEKPILTAEQTSDEERQAEYEYLRDMDDIPEIPDDIAEKFSEVFNAFKAYAYKESNGDSEDYNRSCDQVKKAFFFAYKAHRNQKRRTGEMYIIHPIATAAILVELEFDPGTVVAGLLHDTVEDTVVDIPLIVELFGENIGLLVNGLTKINKMTLPLRRRSRR